MLVTEEQAKEIECPVYVAAGMLIATHSAIASVFVDQVLPSKTTAELRKIKHCRASKCMWWRWFDDSRLDDAKTLGGTDIAPKPKRGYCGLAGKP